MFGRVEHAPHAHKEEDDDGEEEMEEEEKGEIEMQADGYIGLSLCHLL